MFFSFASGAVGSTTSNARWENIATQRLAHIGNKLVQFGLQGFAPDLPVQMGEFGIDCTGHPLTGRINQLANVGQ